MSYVFHRQLAGELPVAVAANADYREIGFL